MNTTIWIIQGVLAAFFLIPAFTKLLLSKEKLVEKKIMEDHHPVAVTKMIGFFELLGSIGIIVPMLTGIMPILTPIAACGLATIMLGAMVVHAQKKEYKMLPMLVVIMALAILVAWYRF